MLISFLFTKSVINTMFIIRLKYCKTNILRSNKLFKKKNKKQVFIKPNFLKKVIQILTMLI